MAFNILKEFRDVLDALDEAGIAHAVCGGIAVILYGHIRATTDIDLLIQADDIPKALEVLEALGFLFRTGPIPFALGTPQERELYRATKLNEDDALSVDLLSVFPVFSTVWQTRQRFEWQGRSVIVVSREGLITMKRLAARPQDLADLENLNEG